LIILFLGLSRLFHGSWFIRDTLACYRQSLAFFFRGLRQARDKDLGIGEGQTATTPDTALNVITYARKQLLVAHEGNEEKLGEYGFEVVIGTAKSPTRKNGNGSNGH
jgi:hypothetical protein